MAERETTPRRYKRGEFFPKVWECLDCKSKISLNKDSFMPPCCAEALLCYECYANNQTDIRCRLCSKRTLYVRIKAVFFRSIEETVHFMIQKMYAGANSAVNTTSKIATENGIDPSFGIFESIEFKWRFREKVLFTQIGEIIRSHKHHKQCQLYQNMGYISQSVAKMRGGKVEVEGHNITIHDVLAFVCAHCGHGSMNRQTLADGEVKGLREHRMYNCSHECCGEYLDRRYLQYGNGQCECGV